MDHIFIRLAALILLGSLTGCAPRYAKYIGRYRNPGGPSVPDFSNLYYWASHPAKKDPADSVPRPLLDGYTTDTTADVFFIHPTTFTDPDNQQWNADINDASVNAKTDYTTVLYQASVFNHYRIFCPRYRQAHVRAYFTSDTSRARAALDLAYLDVKTAFLYYMAHENHGRPVIIASHSQGSTHAQTLLKEFFDGGPYSHQLVAAYVAGMYIPGDKFSQLRPCHDSDQTGCVMGWRTYKEGYEPEFVQHERQDALVTNPLTGTDSRKPVDNKQNKGSILLKFNTIKAHVVGDQIHGNVLWIGKIHLPFSFLIRRKNFHVGDINLFYLNIRDDVRRRVTIYQQKS